MNREIADKVRLALAPDTLLEVEEKQKQVLKLTKAQFIKSYRNRNHFRDLLLIQLKFCGFKMWLVEMVVAVVICGCMYGILQEPFFMTVRKQIFLLTGFTVLVPMLMLPFLYRSIRYQMFEVERVSVFSIKLVLFSKFLVFFGGEIGMEGLLVVFLRWKGAFTWTEIAGCVLVPFLFANDGILTLLKRARPGKICQNILIYGGILLLMVSVILLPERSIVWTQSFPVTAAVGMLVLLGGYGIYEGAGFLRTAER